MLPSLRIDLAERDVDGSGEMLLVVLLARQHLDELGPFRPEPLELRAVDGMRHERSKPYHGAPGGKLMT